MKKPSFIQSLTQPMSSWRQKYKQQEVEIKAKNCKYFPHGSPLMLAIAVLSLMGVMGHRFYNQPQLRIGTISGQTITAPSAGKVENKQKTHQQRQAASKESIPVLMVDQQINMQTNQHLQQLLDQGENIRADAGSFPYFDTFVLSLASQKFLRSIPNSEWQVLVKIVTNSNKQNSGITPGKTPDYSQDSNFSQAVAELQAYHLTNSDQNLSSLITQINKVRQKYAQAKLKLSLITATENSDKVYDPLIFDLSDEDWAKTKTGVQQSLDRILTQGIPPGLPASILQATVNIQVQNLVPKQAQPLAVKLLLSVLQQPNLKVDEVKTKIRQLRAAADVKPVMVEIRKGQVIVSKGEGITPLRFEELEYYHLIRREINWLGLTELGSVTVVSVVIFSLVERRFLPKLRQRDHLLILLLTLTTPLMLNFISPYTTWSMVGLLLGSFYGSILGGTVVGLLLILLPIGLEISKIALVAGAAGGILGSCIAQRLRSREELAILGVGIALTEGGVYLILKLLVNATVGWAWYLILKEAGFFALSGLAWSIVALGLSPYLEKLFDLVTPIRLAELANPNRSLLKRLATETPGTFQHTLFVSTLAEAAAKKLGCNVELVRAGTLYHDIGKMHDPLAFIENQMGGPNKHDTQIKNPWKSASVIKKHVSEGLAMARKHNLPTAIQAFIPEHQGTMLIAYFYHQAQQIAEKNPDTKVIETDFRYAGPIPQSRETAIVMLADSCEAALRSLKDASYEQALAMVNNILRGKWQDNQLVDSGLTREEMSKLGEIFVEVWQQFHHKRIAYPKLQPSNEKTYYR